MNFELQETSSKNRKQWIRLRWLFLLLVFITAIAWAGLKVKSAWAPYNELAFNASVWRSMQNNEHKEPRAKMAGDVINNYLKVGMTENEIVRLLGSPDKLPNLTGFAPPDNPQICKIYQYDMGYAQLDMAGEHHLLRLYFDSGGRCLLFEITKD